MKQESNIAYIAGLFDGEGSVSYNNTCAKEKALKKPTQRGRLD